MDPVRYISNRSTGRMGFALATAARDRGAKVLLVAGPTSVPPPSEVELVRVRSAQEMKDAVDRAAQQADVVIRAHCCTCYHFNAENLNIR